MSQRVLRKRHRTKSTTRPTPALALTLRAPAPIGAGGHARYALGVAEGKIDRAAWARLINDLVRSETKGKKAPFARLVGVDTRTLDRWLNEDVDVREESVRAVARNLGRAPMELLVKVGYYRIEDINPPQPPPLQDDPVVQMIANDPQWDAETKLRLIRREQERIRRDQEQRRADYEWFVEQQRQQPTDNAS